MDYHYGMAQIAQILLELIPPGPLSSTVVLLLILAAIVHHLSPVVSSSLGDDFPHPKTAKYLRAVFGAGFSYAIVLWLASIVIRHMLSF